MKKLLFALPALLFLSLGSLVHAQSVPLTVQTVNTCGTPPHSYTAGKNNPATQDVTGTLCTTGGSGGGGNVTVVGPVDANGNVTVDPVDSGGTSMTRTSDHSENVNVTNNGVAQGSTTSGQTIAPIGCRTLTSAPTDTTAQTNMPSCDTAGALRVNVTATTGATGVAQGSTTSGQSVLPAGCRTLTSAPTDTTAQTNMPSCTTAGGLRADISTVAGTTVSTGTGAQGAGAQRVTVATDSATIAGTASAVGHGTAAAALRVELPTDGTGVVGLAAGTALVGQVSLAPQTTGGLSSFVLEPAANDNHTVIKNGAGQVYSIHYFNNSATINYVRLYNAGTGFNGCNSATNLAWEGHIPANSTNDAGAVINFDNGLAFATGISICVTGSYGQTSTANATATAISLDVLYK